MTTNQVRAIATQHRGAGSRTIPAAQHDFFEHHPPAAGAPAAAASAQRLDRLADRAPGRSAAREDPGAGAETGRVRARGARQQRAVRRRSIASHAGCCAPDAARRSARSRPACARTSTPSTRCWCCSAGPDAAGRSIPTARGRQDPAYAASTACSAPASRAAARFAIAARIPVRRRAAEHRLGGAGSARRTSAAGLLALGSVDRDRFHPGMSTEFLSRMGELITDALARA